MTEPRTAAGRALRTKAGTDLLHALVAMTGARDQRTYFEQVAAIEAEAAELAGGLDADNWESISLALHSFPTWFPEATAKVDAILAAYSHPIVRDPGQDETPRTGEGST